MTVRAVVLIACLVVAFALLSTAANPEAAPNLPSVRRVKDNGLAIGHSFKIDSLNPFIGFSNEAYLFYSLVYDYLFSLDEDQNYVPNLATDAAPAANGAQWVYHVRSGIKWHDGTNLTADDVAFTVNYNIQNFWLLWANEPYLKHIMPCARGQRTNCGAQVTNNATGEVTVYFDRPYAPGRAMGFPIIQRRQWEPIPASDAQYNYSNAHPIGTGPFIAEPDIYNHWIRGEPISLTANPNYHWGAPRVQKVTFQQFQDENALVASLLSGAVDVALLSASGYQAVKSSGNPQIAQQEGITVIQYWTDIGITQVDDIRLNGRLNPARFDLNVRQAMALATDKDFIVQQFYLGKAALGSTLVSPVTPSWHYEPASEKFVYNLTRANEALDAAGYDGPRDVNGIRTASRNIALIDVCATCGPYAQRNVTVPKGTRLSFKMVTRQEAPEENQIALYLKQNWRQVGIDVQITVEEEITMNNDIYGGEYETYIWWWSGDVDPNYLLSIQSNFTLNGWSDNYFDNRSYNVLYLQQLSEFDLTKRRQYAWEAQKVHYVAAPFIIIAYPYFEYAWWTDEFRGWGDMNTHPGRQVGAFWGRHPLLMELEPLGGASGLPGIEIIGVGVGIGLVAAVAMAMVILRGRRHRADEQIVPLPERPQPPH